MFHCSIYKMIYKRADTAIHRSRSPLLPNYLQKYGALTKSWIYNTPTIVRSRVTCRYKFKQLSTLGKQRTKKKKKKKLHFHALISTLTRRRVAVRLVTQKTSAFTRIVRELNRRWPTGCVALSHAFD